MTLERLTQITSVGITSGITLNNATLTGVTTISSLSIDSINTAGIITAQSGLRVTSGSVGIGTTNPDAKLTLYGTNQEDVIHISTGNNAGDTFANIRGDNESGIRIRGGGSYDGGTIELSGGLRDSDPGIIKFSTGVGVNPAERLRITKEGRIGIGTTTPADSIFQVIGDVRIGNSIGDSGRQLIFNANRESASDTIANLNFEWNSTTVAQIRAQAGSDTTNKDDGHLVFFTAPEGAIQERLRITSEGDVGINVTPTNDDMPGVKPRLHVVGISSNSQFNTVARFEAGGDSNETGSAIVLNHSNDRGIAIQGGRYLGNRSFGAIKTIDNVGRITDAITVFGGNNSGVSSVTVYTGEATTTTERFAIDASGRVTMPYQPAWSVFSGNNSYNNTEAEVWDGIVWIGGENHGTIHVNTGNHYTSSNGRFTAPVAGKYWVYFSVTTGDNNSHFVNVLKNGLSIGDSIQLSYSQSLLSANWMGVVDLAANDYLQATRRATGYRFYNLQWGGYLIG